MTDDEQRGKLGSTRDEAERKRALTFAQRMRAYLMTGILVVAPISITFYLAWIFIGFVDRQVTPLIPAAYNPETYLPFALPGLGLIVLIAGLILIGAATAGFFGRLWSRVSEQILARMPVIRNVHSAVKQILETVLAQQSNAFREAVLVEYPRRGIWAIAFITGRTEGEVQSITAEECINIFLPTTPNPTSGFLLFVPKKDLVPLSMGVEEAIKMVISGGIVTPPDRRPAAEKNVVMTSAVVYEDLEVLRELERTPVLAPKGTRPGERKEASLNKPDDIEE
ncbi:MAG: DUF502 domain-containing protein [Rhodospirillaceae bacterium]|jgi:uncharacterized membrane protein|nr:DUF502 domain-containing protein [Rhodospirillaceae bacterium]MBT3909886.1 DUF502 domain-containing protein [Rhodospirillaceae bacterium]MBT5297601.1 DUF502 domain-containing protein [Rhodospirillaceae bacterium]MBT6085973.1 DUF502 domain-containing protein [Rhodospirillaceae bacterium]MBT6883545.1 DUF502 domain-containing protein [Rhodospirillaceae bacterium]